MNEGGTRHLLVVTEYLGRAGSPRAQARDEVAYSARPETVGCGWGLRGELRCLERGAEGNWLGGTSHEASSGWSRCVLRPPGAPWLRGGAIASPSGLPVRASTDWSAEGLSCDRLSGPAAWAG